MKKLICEKDICCMVKKGKKVFYIDEQTIITPAGKDMAKTNNIVFTKKEKNTKLTETEVCQIDRGIDKKEVDKEMIYKVLKTMHEKGHLKDIL